MRRAPGGGILEPGGISSTPSTITVFSTSSSCTCSFFPSRFSLALKTCISKLRDFADAIVAMIEDSPKLTPGDVHPFSLPNDSIWRPPVFYCHFWIPIINAAASTGTLLFDSCFTRHFHFRYREIYSSQINDSKKKRETLIRHTCLTRIRLVCLPIKRGRSRDRTERRINFT